MKIAQDFGCRDIVASLTPVPEARWERRDSRAAEGYILDYGNRSACMEIEIRPGETPTLMSYMRAIVEPLIDTLKRFATLNPHQLAGQVANNEFWVGEIKHALAVIDGYRQRFERLKTAQTNHAKEHGTVEFQLMDDVVQSAKPPRQGVPDADRKQLRRELMDAAYRFLVRSANTGLLTRAELDSNLSEIGLSADPGDLDSHLTSRST